MLAIYKKELKSYFTSMIGFAFIAFFLAIVGIYFMMINLLNGYSNFEYALDGVSFLFVVLIPIITMKVMAEENKQKTDQLLLTSPVSVEKIVLGKYLAVFTLFAITMAVIMFYPLILTQFGTSTGKVDLGLAYNSIFGFTLLGAAYIAIGLFISALTESQVLAAVVSFIVMLFTFFMTGLGSALPKDNKSSWLLTSILFLVVCYIIYFNMHNSILSTGIAALGEITLVVVYLIKPTLYDSLIVKIFSWFSIIDRFDNFKLGVVDMTAIVYYLSVIFVFIFLTIMSIKKRRWN